MVAALPLTRHAATRLHERDLDNAAVALVLDWGTDTATHAGCVRRVLRRIEAGELLTEGCSPALVRAAGRIELVVGADGSVVTACRRLAPAGEARRRRRVDRNRRGREHRHPIERRLRQG